MPRTYHCFALKTMQHIFNLISPKYAMKNKVYHSIKAYFWEHTTAASFSVLA